MASLTVAEALALAVQQHRAGQLAQAEQLYRAILQADPRHVEAHYLRGLAAFGLGRLEAAAASLVQALDLRPDFAEAHLHLGLVRQAQGQPAEESACYRQALRCRPDYAEAHYNLGNVLQSQGELAEAASSYRQALRLQPDYAEAHNNLGVALQRQGNFEEAAASYRQVLRLQSDYANVHNNLGVALQRLGKIEEAVASYRQALRLQPDYAEARNNLGDALLEQGKLDEAVASLRQALCFQPNYAEAHNNLGVVLQKQGKIGEAIASYGQAAHLRPDYPEAHLNRALAWLLAGQYEQGWSEYEWRWRCEGYSLPTCAQPRWDGSPLQGRTILLRAEQGLGDTLQFVRYAPLVRQRGGTVLVQCQQPLLRLLAGCPGIDRLAVQGAPVPEAFNVQAPLLSLPGLLGTTLATVPAQVPYLFADPELVRHWRQQLSPLRAFKIGIAWQGSPGYRGDRSRSIPLVQFAPLARLEGVQLVSLQKGHGTEQLHQVADQFSVLDLGSRLDETAGAFMDTAAVMRDLDLVIACDTAIAHLAGALAVPVWVALASVPSWCWLLHREDSPWYPTARLFRQTEPDGWHGVFERIAGAVRKLLQ